MVLIRRINVSLSLSDVSMYIYIIGIIDASLLIVSMSYCLYFFNATLNVVPCPIVDDFTNILPL